MISKNYALLLVAVMAGVTILLRFLPFLIFAKKTPEPVLYLGKYLPGAIMAMLLVYCLKGVSLVSSSHGIPELVSVVLVILLHKWKHNTLLSILGGTLCYMLFVQVIFPG